MKYLLLLHHPPEFMDSLPEPVADVMAEVERLMDELRASGEWIDGQGLAPPADTKVVRVRGGQPVVTDGPYLEAKEHLVGFCMIDVASPERALEIAAAWPDARWNGVEVRPIMTPGGE
jgi:hypothetical protein